MLSLFDSENTLSQKSITRVFFFFYYNQQSVLTLEITVRISEIRSDNFAKRVFDPIPFLRVKVLCNRTIFAFTIKQFSFLKYVCTTRKNTRNGRSSTSHTRHARAYGPLQRPAVAVNTRNMCNGLTGRVLPKSQLNIGSCAFKARVLSLRTRTR